MKRCSCRNFPQAFFDTEFYVASSVLCIAITVLICLPAFVIEAFTAFYKYNPRGLLQFLGLSALAYGVLPMIHYLCFQGELHLKPGQQQLLRLEYWTLVGYALVLQLLVAYWTLPATSWLFPYLWKGATWGSGISVSLFFVFVFVGVE